MKLFNEKSGKFLLLLVVITLVFTFLANRLALGWLSATIWAMTMYFVLIIYTFKTKDELMAKSLIWGTVAGFFELVADSWAVRVINALVYPAEGYFLWDSPLYMPFFWAYMLGLLAYISVPTMEKFGFFKTTIFYTLGGIAVGPGIEFLADGAKWWYYHNTHSILGSPIYIVGGEILIFMSIPFFGQLLQQETYKHKVAVLGITYGIYLLFAYAFVYYTFDIGSLH